jgi:hypothetical protein
MTHLTRAVRRRTCRTSRSAHDRYLIVTLSPGDLISVRVVRSRREYRTTIERLYEMLVAQDARAEAFRRQGLRGRCRAPRRRVV